MSAISPSRSARSRPHYRSTPAPVTCRPRPEALGAEDVLPRVTNSARLPRVPARPARLCPVAASTRRRRVPILRECPAAHTTFQSFLTAAVFYRISTLRGWMCRSYGLAVFRSQMSRTLLGCWWGPGVLATPIILIANRLRLSRVLQLDLTRPSPGVAASVPAAMIRASLCTSRWPSVRRRSALQAYRRRLTDLETEVDEAEWGNDPERARRCRSPRAMPADRPQ
jgi:hypothetical protein